jgi:hypothetical protein
MGIVALIAWLSTAGGGLYLLAVWLIEYDREYQTSAKTRLPIPVISGHALLALAGLVVWAAYLFSDDRTLAWAALADLGVVAALGLTMAWRWLRVYRAPRSRPQARPASVGTVAATGIGMLPRPGAPGADPDGWSPARNGRGPVPDEWDPAPEPPGGLGGRNSIAGPVVPPERNFPVTVVIAHGLLAVTTIVLVAITAIRGL